MANKKSADGLVYELSGIDRVEVSKDLTYEVVDGLELKADVYSPPGLKPGEALPAVLYLHGDGPSEYLRTIKDTPQYLGWGKLTAATGLIGITFNRRSTQGYTRLRDAARDVEEMIAFLRANRARLRIDSDRLGVWCCSAGPPAGLSGILREAPAFVRAVAVYYGVMDLRQFRDQVDPEITDETLREFSPLYHLEQSSAKLPPILLARAGRDNPALNEAVDRFLVEALRRDVAIELINHPEGHHGFDVFDDDDRSREVIARTLSFLKHHLIA